MKPLMKSIYLLSLLGMATLSFANTSVTSESRQTVDIDPNAPIVALEHLQSLKNPTKLQVNLPKIEHFSTENGTPVAFVQAKQLPMIDIAVYFNAGSARDESIKKGAYGLANLTATLLTQGTKQYTENELAEALEQLGIALSINAHKDMFAVNLRSLSDKNYLYPAVDLLSQILSEPTFDKDNLERTKARLLIGLQRSLEHLDTVASQTFFKELYGSHPYAHPTSGTLDSVPTIEANDLKKFHQQFLVAKNANIAITGDISLDEAKQIANRITQSLPIGSPAPSLPDAQPLTKGKHVHIPFESQQTSIIMGQLADKRLSDPQSLEKNIHFSVADDVVGGGNFQARLMADIRKKRGLTYGIYSHVSRMQSQGHYAIRFSTRNDKRDEAINATLNVINDTIKNGITQQELDLTKENLINSFPTMLSSNASINGTLASMGFYGLSDQYLSNYVSWLENTNLADANQSYAELIKPDNFLIVTVGHIENTP